MIPEYEQAVGDAGRPASTADNLADAVAIASLPDQVRGYEHLKLDRADALPHRARRPPRRVPLTAAPASHRPRQLPERAQVDAGGRWRRRGRRRRCRPRSSSAAGTISVSTSMCGSHLSAFRLAPPPTMISSGENSLTTVAQVALDPLGPLLPRQLLAVAGARRGPVLGVVAVDLEVAELGVRHEHAVDEQPRTDAGAERQHEHDAAAVAAGAVAHLGEPGGVGVVDDVDVLAGRLA